MDEQDIPIDIHASKLSEWLVSRRHVQRDWPDNVRVIREKINNAIQDMPEHPEITRLLSGTYINYFHCIKIVEILKETEKDSKNILGWYGSQRMKDWLEIVRLYEKDNVYLAEAAQVLTRNINYEVPSIKRQIAKGVQIQQECDRKVAECIKSSENAEKKYHQMCKEIGIAGEKIKHELLDLLKTLPDEFSAVAKSSKELTKARHLYSDFVSFITRNSDTEVLPLLKFVIDHGNVTTYEWVYGQAPCSIEEPALDIVLEDEVDKAASDEIDFGDGGNTIDFGDPSTEIDFGDDLTSGDIDWGNLATEESQTIEWGVGETDDDPVIDIVVEESGVEGGVARESEALSVLHNPQTRNQFIDELLELEGFLKQRLTELESKGSVFLNQYANAPVSVQDHTKEEVAVMLSKVKSLLGKLSTTKMQHLYLISSSSRYVDRITDSLRSKLLICDRLEDSKKVINKRKEDTIEEMKQLTPQLKVIIERNKELQSNIQEHISKKYKNRPVNLMGATLTMQA